MWINCSNQEYTFSLSWQGLFLYCWYSPFHFPHLSRQLFSTRLQGFVLIFTLFAYICLPATIKFVLHLYAARENGKKYQDPRFCNSYSFGCSGWEIWWTNAQQMWSWEQAQLGLSQLELENPLNFKKENCIVSYCGLLGALYLTPPFDPIHSTYSTTV